MGSFFVALFLLGLLLAVRSGFNQGVDVAQADRLVVTNKTSLIQPLPYATKDKVASTPGVAVFTWANWFGGVYQDPKNFFAQFAIDVEHWRAVYSRVRGEGRRVGGLRGRPAGGDRGQGHRRPLRLEGGRPHPHPGRRLPGSVGVQPAGHLHGPAAQRRSHPVLVPMEVPERAGAGVRAGPHRLVRHPPREGRQSRRRWRGASTPSSRTPPSRRARSRRAPSCRGS